MRKIGNLTLSQLETRVTNTSFHLIDVTPEQARALPLKTLGLGLGFIPTPKPFSLDQAKQDFKLFRRTIHLRHHFNDSKTQDDNDNSNNNNNKQPSPFRRRNRAFQGHIRPEHSPLHRIAFNRLNAILDELEARFLSTIKNSQRRQWSNNLPQRNRRDLQLLAKSPELIVKPTDKNLGISICSRSWYRTQVDRHLSNRKIYEPVTVVDYNSIHKDMTILLRDHSSYLPQELVKYLEQHLQDHSIQRVPYFYILPKVHKDPIASRPIVAAVNWILTPASKFVDYHLQPLIKLLDKHILMDTSSLIDSLEETPLPADCTLITADVESLYTNIDTDSGIRHLSQTLHKFRQELNYTTEFCQLICSLAYLVLKHNYLRVGKRTDPSSGKQTRLYHQVSGTAMGTNVAPPYANIFVWACMTQWRQTYGSQLLLEKRLIDDILLIVSSDTDSAQCLQDLQAAIGINLTWEISQQSVDFLDLTIFKGNRFQQTGIMDSRVYQKPLNKYLYLPFKSAHTHAMKRAFIKGELIRYRRNCSSEFDFNNCCKLFFKRLRARGFPHSFLMSAFAQVSYADRTPHPATSTAKQPPDPSQCRNKPLVFKTRITPQLRPAEIREALTLTTVHALQECSDDQELYQAVAKALPDTPIICVQKSQNLKDILVKAHEYY
jgi:hypothetical protein